MPSMFEQSMMLDALSGAEDNNYPRGMAAYRAEAHSNPEKWQWCFKEARKRKRK